MCIGLNLIGVTVKMTESQHKKKKTWEETKNELIEADVDNFFTNDMFGSYFDRAGFLQKSSGVDELLNEEICRITGQIVKEGLLAATTASVKTLRREHAIKGIEATSEIPSGTY
jgi:hypothetical protein